MLFRNIGIRERVFIIYNKARMTTHDPVSRPLTCSTMFMLSVREDGPREERGPREGGSVREVGPSRGSERGDMSPPDPLEPPDPRLLMLGYSISSSSSLSGELSLEGWGEGGGCYAIEGCTVHNVNYCNYAKFVNMVILMGAEY